MHLCILPNHQNHVLKKDIFEHMEWLKTCFHAFAHTSRPPETFFKKEIFYRLEWWKTCFDAFAHTSRPPKTFFQKIYFLPSGVVKDVFWCFCAYFQTIKNFFSKNIFLKVWSGWKRVLMLLRVLPDHQKLFCKKDIFDRLERLKTCFDAFMHTSRPPESCP